MDVAILFADVAGSTRLYELFGDQTAKALIDACLRCMRDAAVDSRGRVVKIIGDEISRIVAWKQSADVSRLAGGAVRLRFVMKDADLYAIQFP